MMRVYLKPLKMFVDFPSETYGIMPADWADQLGAVKIDYVIANESNARTCIEPNVTHNCCPASLLHINSYNFITLQTMLMLYLSDKLGRDPTKREFDRTLNQIIAGAYSEGVRTSLDCLIPARAAPGAYAALRTMQTNDPIQSARWLALRQQAMDRARAMTAHADRVGTPEAHARAVEARRTAFMLSERDT